LLKAIELFKRVVAIDPSTLGMGRASLPTSGTTARVMPIAEEAALASQAVEMALAADPTTAGHICAARSLINNQFKIRKGLLLQRCQ
jgi:hypothetical protein